MKPFAAYAASSRLWSMRRTRSTVLCVCLLCLSGCETLNPLTIGVGLASYATTGKGLADHAIGTFTQQDCNIIGGLFSAARRICEPKGSQAADLGFKGLFAQSWQDEAPHLQLSETVAEMAAPVAVGDAETDAVPVPVLRLSDSITPIATQTPGRLAQANGGVETL